jgi:succinate dehydrogenase hydrophobic anchor subunit
MVQNSEEESPEAKRRHWALPHVAGVALAILAYFLIYSVTGDSDLFIALATGAVGIGLTWAVLEVEFWFRNRKGA